jgi:NAD(P)-dependent dehydrogenase (short-subunit alcohol dehydrogenase family)
MRRLDSASARGQFPGMNLELDGRVALVTGGASGIGEATVRMLHAEGARVAIADRNAERGAALARELGGHARFIETDLTVEADCRRAVEETVAAFGGLQILVNNAGVNDAVSLEHSPADFTESLRRNLFHVFAVTHFALPHLRALEGVVVNVSSKVASTGQGSTSGYAAAKGGVNSLTREWAVALAPDGIRVNGVVPAECLTPQYERWFESLSDPAGARAAVERLVPLGGRMTLPDEVAAAIVFFASKRSSHTTGQLLFVDGGYTHLDRAASGDGQRWG